MSSVSFGASARQQRLKETYTLAHRAHNIAQAWSRAPEEVDIVSHAFQLSTLAKALMKP